MSQKHKDHVENNAGNERDATDAAAGRERAGGGLGGKVRGGAQGSARCVWGNGWRRPCTC